MLGQVSAVNGQIDIRSIRSPFREREWRYHNPNCVGSRQSMPVKMNQDERTEEFFEFLGQYAGTFSFVDGFFCR